MLRHLRRLPSALALAAVLIPLAVLAANGSAPGKATLDRPFGFGPEAGITVWANAAFKFGLVAAVLAAAIFIGIGAYLYFAATGNAELARQGKEYISRSIIGLVLALLAWVILQTISPQFTKLDKPTLNAAPVEQARG